MGDKNKFYKRRIPCLLYTSVFLSTPSARRATQEAPELVCNLEISIHALREEGDVEATLDGLTPFPLVKDIVGYLKMCHSILPIKR